MGTCKYCGKSAGLFSSCHSECEEKHSKGVAELRSVLASYFKGAANHDTIKAAIHRLSANNYLTSVDISGAGASVLSDYAEGLKRPYPASILTSVRDFINITGATYSSLNTNGSIDKIAQKLIKGFMVEYFTGQLPLSTAMSRAQKVLSAFPLTREKEQEAYFYVLNKAATNFMKDGILTDNEEKLISDYTNALALPMNNLPATYRGSDINRIGQAVILKDLQRGIVPQTNVGLPIILGKNENILWAYGDVACYMEKIQRETVGRSGGFSFRVCKGVTYRTGQFEGHPVEHSYMDKVGTGTLFVTTKNLIFYSESKSTKVQFNKIIGITPYSDGIEVHKDGNAKRLTFQGFDCCFIMNVLSVVNDIKPI